MRSYKEADHTNEQRGLRLLTSAVDGGGDIRIATGGAVGGRTHSRCAVLACADNNKTGPRGQCGFSHAQATNCGSLCRGKRRRRQSETYPGRRRFAWSRSNRPGRSLHTTQGKADERNWTTIQQTRERTHIRLCRCQSTLTRSVRRCPICTWHPAHSNR